MELPGLKKEDLLLEFIDETTILIEGCVKRQISDKFTQHIPTADDTADKNAFEDDSTYVKIHIKNNLKKLYQVTYWYKERVLDNVKAPLKNGLLYIMVPKSITCVPKKIAID
ncbi:hypothetical protein PMAC_003029 [Pneumocystis sp. 'macacae']|nr:hypothetical protein PMAC_003029 [Pneumocystis sp. 'macacae']